MLKVSMFCRANLATPLNSLLSELTYLSASFPVLSLMILRMAAHRLFCIMNYAYVYNNHIVWYICEYKLPIGVYTSG